MADYLAVSTATCKLSFHDRSMKFIKQLKNMVYMLNSVIYLFTFMFYNRDRKFK